jgi:ubiquinone/menaquinone biosynthesis C-methylase UbiE
MSNPLLTSLHDIASIGWVYDAIQFLAGAPIVRRRLRTHLSGYRGRILDIGGGTGAVAELLPGGCFCTCLDNEMPKLRRCAVKGRAVPLLADATRMPIQSASVDVVTCVAMAHHLADDQLARMFRECARVLQPHGSMIFLDPVLKPSRVTGRILWALDRGSHPRSAATLGRAIEQEFIVERWERLAIYHEYAIAICRKPEASR